MRAALARKKWRSADAVPFVPTPTVQLQMALERGEAAAVTAALAAAPADGWHVADYAAALRHTLTNTQPAVLMAVAEHWHEAQRAAGVSTCAALADLSAALPDFIQLAVAARSPVLLEFAIHHLVLRGRVAVADHRALVGALAEHPAPVARGWETSPPPPLSTLFTFTTWLLRNRDRAAAQSTGAANDERMLGPPAVAADAAAACAAALHAPTRWPGAAAWLVHLFGADRRFVAAVRAADGVDVATLPAAARRILAAAEAAGPPSARLSDAPLSSFECSGG